MGKEEGKGDGERELVTYNKVVVAHKCVGTKSEERRVPGQLHKKMVIFEHTVQKWSRKVPIKHQILYVTITRLKMHRYSFLKVCPGLVTVAIPS